MEGPGLRQRGGRAAARRPRRRRAERRPTAAAARRGGARQQRGAAAGRAGRRSRRCRRPGPRGCPSSSRRTASSRRSNLDKGELMWQVPHGDTPDAVRNHPALQGPEHPEDRPAGQRRHRRDQDARHRRRSAGDDAARTSARRDAARLRQADRPGSRRRVDARAAERLADDLQGLGRPPVHRRRGQRRQLLGRVHLVRAAASEVRPTSQQ